MQRYQLNYKLLIGLVVGAVVLGGGLFGLWKLQSYRGAEKLLTLAEEDRAKGDLQGAAANLYRYSRMRPKDEARAAEMAMTYAEVAELEDIEPQDLRSALGIMEATVRTQRKNAELRRRLVDLLMNFGAIKEATEHLEIMVTDDPKNGELLSMLGSCYVGSQQNEKGLRLASEVVGYDRKTGEFDPEKAAAPQEVAAYQQLAGLLRQEKTDPVKIDEVMQRMIEVNPESAEAYVARGQYFFSLGEEKKAEAMADIEKALELDQNNLDALLIRARLYAMDEDYDKAKGLLERGLEAEPDSAAVYMTMAMIASQEEGPSASIPWFEQGVQKTTGGAQIGIKFALARALINANQLDEARRLIKDLEQVPQFQKHFLEFLKGRLLVSENKWYPAAQTLSEIRPLLLGNVELSAELNSMLALCYTRLEQWELAENAASRVLQINPQNKIAIDLRENAERRIGRKPATGGETTINDLVRDELNKPVDEQDWASVRVAGAKYADEMIEEGRMTPSGKKLLLAEIHIRAKEYKQAEKLVRQAITEDPDNINNWRLACRLTATDPDGGAVKAMKMLDEVAKKFKDAPLLRLDRADLYMTLNDEKVVDQMLSVSEGIEDWPVQDQVMIWQGLATRFEALRATEALDTARRKVATLAPNELSNLLDLFAAARAENDDARMADAQAKILKVVGSEQDVNYMFTEAQRLVSLYQRGLEDKQALAKARQLIKRGQEQRPEWHMLSLLLADLAIEEKNASLALQRLDEAAKLGPPTARSLMQHVSLLMQSGRFDDARRQMDRAAPAFRERLLGRQYAESLFNSRYAGERDKRWEESVSIAQEAAALAPEDADMQLWLGRFLLRASLSPRLSESTRTEAAKASGVAFAKTIELAPKSQEAWLAYLSYLATTKQTAAAREAVRQVQLALDEDQLPLVLGAGYEVLGRWFDAENVYTRALEENSENVQVARRLAAFYLGGGYPLGDKIEKATPLINQILKAGAENPELAADENVLWARRSAAKLLAQTGDYQKALDAERLLASNVVNGELAMEDRLTMAKILATRPEPASKVKAVRLYEDALQTQDLDLSDQLMLGQLYYATGNWERCQRQMTELISKNRDNPQIAAARDAYIRMLLMHDEGSDLNDAARQLKQLQELAPTEPSTLELLVRISSKLGRQQDVIPVLKGLLSRKENQQNPAVIIRVATLLADLDDLDNAEKLFRIAAKMTPNANLALADFLGQHRDLDQALDLMESVEDEVGTALVLQYTSAMLKAKEDQVTDEQFDRVEGWLARAQREDPDSIKLGMQEAELLDTRKQYQESAEVYRRLLARKELAGFERAVVLNNLAYQLALAAPDSATTEEAMGYVTEAADILGPRSDILDTRAVVRMAMQQYDAAVADMELAVTDGPTASKYFHKARAHLLAREDEKAVAAWEKALDMGLTAEDIGVVERKVYDEVEAKINRLRSSSASRAPAAR